MTPIPPRPAPAQTRRPKPADSRDRDDPAWKSVELAQRGRMILDVATADLALAEARLGPFHETSWFFRNALAEARRSWDRLRAEFGGAALEAALAEPPVAVLTLDPGISGRRPIELIPIGGKTYRVERLAPTDLAPSLCRLTRLSEHDDSPYYLVRLRDGSLQCDCAEWTYARDDTAAPIPCKHLSALASLGWL